MRAIFIALMICWHLPVLAQTQWVLKKNEDGIKVYTGNVSNSNIKAIKVECTINTSIPKLCKFLLDAKAHEQWVYNTKSSYIIKNIGDMEQVYYSEISMPWPLKNRDVVVHLKLVNTNDVLTVSAIGVSGYISPKKDMVRVPMSVVTWTVKPLSAEQLSIEYTAQADPGGDVPAWVTNMFCTKGPFETFKSLRAKVKNL